MQKLDIGHPCGECIHTVTHAIHIADSGVQTRHRRAKTWWIATGECGRAETVQVPKNDYYAKIAAQRAIDGGMGGWRE